MAIISANIGRRVIKNAKLILSIAILLWLLLFLGFLTQATFINFQERMQKAKVLNHQLHSIDFPTCKPYDNPFVLGDTPELIVLQKMGNTRKRKEQFVEANAKLRLKVLEEKKTHTSDKLITYDQVLLEPWKHSDIFSNYPRITYYNGHRGCNENFHAVLSRLHLNFNIVNPRNITRYGMRQIDAQELIDSGFVSALCDLSDVIVVADTVPDARGILLSLVDPDPSRRCKSNIVIEMTNRYDWMVGDTKEYHEMLVKLINDPPKNLFWTANNPFEGEFMRAKIGKGPRVKLLRSLGAWNVDIEGNSPKKNTDVQPANIENSLVILSNPDIVNRPIIEDILKFFCMPVAKLPKKYGGPAGLLKYKGFIEFPYQVSVMKFYENIAFGVPQVIPTPHLLRLLVKTNNHHYFSTWLDKLEQVQMFLSNPEMYQKLEAEKERKAQEKKDKEEREGKKKVVPTISKKKMKQQLQQPTPTASSNSTTAQSESHRLERRAVGQERERIQRQQLQPTPKLDVGPYNATWTELADFYSKEFSPFVYYFDSFQELTDLINMPLAEFDYKNVRVEGPKYYAKVREESMKTWLGLFHSMGFKSVKDFRG
ncbi:UNVERIFIED_CONTAM: hypothetical protein HDU68_007376 [Siphonaria sp. JEL0065]|nr:hypothetical protein HDU68_007376 [Siphonaria sp. JEL0065]